MYYHILASSPLVIWLDRRKYKWGNLQPKFRALENNGSMTFGEPKKPETLAGMQDERFY